ncbi:hypothetical protein V8E53_009387, partial [Lactarius tabidus]
DNARRYVFQTVFSDSQNVTVESCTTSCASQNLTLAKLEHGVQCFCGNRPIIDGASNVSDLDCKSGHNSNKVEERDGLNRVSIYILSIRASNSSVSVVPTVQTTNLPGQWQYSRCIAEPMPANVLPYRILLANNNSAENCLDQCSTFGYPAAGMENGQECWCGDVADIADNGGKTAAESDCEMPCTGDPLHLCGGTWRLQLYLWKGNLNIWSTPANIGGYEYLVEGPVPPLLAALNVNGKIAFLEKGKGSGLTAFTNSSGAYELDLSLIDDVSRAWRTMHIKTDVFCSAAVILPDKGARLFDVGGWSQNSSVGLRLYTPDGSPGVNGTNDWEESPGIFQLQLARWYPTALVLSNGSVLVMGGLIGAGGPDSATLEIVPQIPGGSTLMSLDWLENTNPNNLYPFLHILPGGSIFVGDYNDARLIDQGTFATVKVLPPIPGSVNNALAGRNYPYEGASVLFPLRPPYANESTVMICGGSDSGGNALDNCVSIQPEAENPTWVIERMPSRRVMPCMVSLPDGTFMIMNGAQQGIAGFDDAENPNLSALLYDPSQPVNARVSVLNNTSIARMYHSEATLLQDGRVLVSGSDPNPNGEQTFPEELRIEVYIPPYLNQGHKPPVVTIPNTDWAHDVQYQINIQLFQGQTSGMRVSLVLVTASTHGNTMGGRVIFPAFQCSGNACHVTAPPNPWIAPPGWYQLFILDGPTPSTGVFVRIGGDPAQLGNWPALPGFQLPGT